MRLEYCRKKGKLDNRGSALVSVLDHALYGGDELSAEADGLSE